MTFMSVSHTPNLVEFRGEKIWPSNPHGTPSSHPCGMTQVAKWKSRLICFIFFICEKTHKVGFKDLWNWLSNWNLMIFNDIWPFGPSPGTQGARPKTCVVARPIHMSNSHTKFGWISSNGLGWDIVMDGRTDRQTDRQTDGGDCNIPDAFLKKRGDNKVSLNSIHTTHLYIYRFVISWWCCKQMQCLCLQMII